MYKIRNLSSNSQRQHSNNNLYRQNSNNNSNPQHCQNNSPDKGLLNSNKEINEQIHSKSKLNFYQPNHLKSKQQNNLDMMVRKQQRMVPVLNLKQIVKANKQAQDRIKQQDSLQTSSNNTNLGSNSVHFENNSYRFISKQFSVNKKQDFVLKSQIIRDSQQTNNKQKNFLDQLKYIKSRQTVLDKTNKNQQSMKNNSYVDCSMSRKDQLKLSNNNSYRTRINNFTSNGISLETIKYKRVKKETKIYFVTNLLQTWFNQQTSQKWLFEEYQNYIPSLIKSIVFARQLEKHYKESSNMKQVYLGSRPRNVKKTLVFDLDETLVHCSQNSNTHFEQIINLNVPEIGSMKMGLNIRPFAKKVLAELRQYYEIVIFTASHEFYAQTILRHLCENEELIDHCLFRDKCTVINDRIHIKDLGIFKDRDLKDLLIIDNHLYSFSYHLNNGLPILPFHSNKKDRQLQELCEFLLEIRNVEDIGQMIQNVYGFKEYYSQLNVNGFVQMMDQKYRKMKMEECFRKK